MNTSLTWAKRWLTTILALLLVVGAGVLCIVLPPLVAFEPRPLLALALVALGGGAALWRGEGAIRVAVRLAGAAALWAIIFWCALSQPIAFYQPIGVIAAQRALPVVLLTGVWACLALPRTWQQGAAAAVTAPTLLALTFIGWVDLPRTANFLPNYLVVDSHHTLYVADRDMGAIRVFGPDGGLRAKLWPGLASHLGPPGPGFSPAGPYSDPDHLGIQAVLRASGAAPAAATWTPATDRFRFCGLALDERDRLYVPNPNRGEMLRFAPDGHLQALWALPDDYQWPSGCVAVSRDRVYLADARGAVLIFSVDGKPLDRWSLPEPIGSLAVSPDGARIYALSATHLLTLSAKGDDLKSWDLAGPSAGIATLPPGRVLVGDHLYSRVDVFCADGSLCGQIGEAGRWPGQFDRMGDLTADRDGRLYISDYGHRAVQSFTPSGHITALYWSVEDDEHE